MTAIPKIGDFVPQHDDFETFGGSLYSKSRPKSPASTLVPGRTWAELTSKWRRVNSESRALLAEQKGGRTRWILRNLAMPASAVVHSPKVMMSDELETLDQRMAAVGVLFRLRIWRCVDALRPLASKTSL